MNKDTDKILVSIKAAMDRQDKTRYWLAKQVGIIPQHIYPLLDGRRHLNSEMASKMFSALGLTIRASKRKGAR